MKAPISNIEKIRDELRALRRGDLLIIAERAVELVPRALLDALLGDYVRLDALAPQEAPPTSLLEETRRFHTESLGGRYFESFPVNSRNCAEHSSGTETFIAEFHRLLDKCVQALGSEAHRTVREAFELLFLILRRIDEAQDDVLFFADEGGSVEVGVPWRKVLPVYFRCLGESSSPAEFARVVDEVITAFAEHDRPWLLTEARKVDTARQRHTDY